MLKWLKKWLGIVSPSLGFKATEDERYKNYIHDVIKRLEDGGKNDS